MHISELAVEYLKTREFGCLVTNPVYDESSSEYYFTYNGYIVSLFINVAVKEINNELFVVIIDVENNTYESDVDKLSHEEFLNSLISDVFHLKELFNQFPMSLKKLLKDRGGD